MEQKVIDHINNSLKKHCDRLDQRSNYPPGPALKDLMTDVAAAFTGTQSFDDRLLNRIRNETNYELSSFIHDVLSKGYYYTADYPWTTNTAVVKQLIHRRHIIGTRQQDGLIPHIWNYIHWLLTTDSKEDTKTCISFLHGQGFTNEDLVDICVNRYSTFYRSHLVSPQELSLTKFSEFIIPHLKPSKGFLGLGKSSGLKKRVDDVIFNDGSNAELRTSWLMLLFDHYPEGIENFMGFLLVKDHNGTGYFNTSAAYLLLKRDASAYQDHIMKALEQGALQEAERFQLLLALNAALNGKYKQPIIDSGEKHLTYFTQTNHPGSYYYEPHVDKKTLTEAYIDFLEKENAAQAKERLARLFTESTFLSDSHFKFAEHKFGKDALPWLVEGLKKDPKNLPQYNSSKYYDVLFGLLKKYDLREFKEMVVDFALHRATKKSRLLAAEALAAMGTEIMAEAKAMLTGKTVDQRVTAALILAGVETPEAESALNEAVDEESNDDTRDIMLDALSEKRFATPYTLEQVRRMIHVASERKKLGKWNEKWIDEAKVPKAYWSDGQALTETDIRFLFYRMKRAPGLNSDIEARQALHHIDRPRSQAFAKALLTAFQDSNADIKLKYYLTLGALLGDDEMMHNLNTLFKKSIADKRAKMAEYVVGALAMVGTDKALRIVEVIYRKFATKKPAVSQAAKAALDAAATELNITMDELSDRIIPDFDFDGLYKKFEVDGNEYRAFINSDFKLNYFTEDNKVRKSLPANASKELKAEFKDIEKEVNDVIKSQSGRLEKYLIEERRWSSEGWKQFFFNNPIMFVYAMKLLWGVFNKDGILVDSFYCSEDTSLYNTNDDEIILEADQFVGILHPLHLSESQLSGWKDKVYAMSLMTIFPILDRPMFVVSNDEKENNVTKMFFDKNIPKGADFVNTFLVKQNWRKSTGDGGSSEFTKLYKDGLVKAIANIEGPAAWYQGGNTPAKMYEVIFVGKNWQDKIQLKNIQRVFYSEVMADIYQMINAN
jgi:hypothetical protein